MPKKQKRPRHVHVDNFAAQSAAHQAEVARDQERWKAERVDLDLPEKRARGDHKARRANSPRNPSPTSGE
jgi:hypothetical protein